MFASKVGKNFKYNQSINVFYFFYYFIIRSSFLHIKN